MTPDLLFRSLALLATAAISTSELMATAQQPSTFEQALQQAAQQSDPEGDPAALELAFPHPRPAVTTFSDAAGAMSGDAAAASLPDVSFLSIDDAPEGDLPLSAAFTPNGAALLVVNRDTDNITRFDVATRTATATAPVGDFPTDIAITSSGAFAVVTNLLDDTVTVLDATSLVTILTIPVTGSEPYRVEITDDDAFAVVGVINDGVASAISVIDLGTFTEARSIPTGPQGSLGSLGFSDNGAMLNFYTQFAVAPNSQTLVLPDRSNDQVTIYDITTGALVATVPTAADPTAVDIDAASSFAVITHEGNAQTISVIDLVTNTVSSTIATGISLRDRAIRLVQNDTFAVAVVQNGIAFVELATGIVDTPISLFGFTRGIDVTFDDSAVVVAHNDVSIIDTTTRSLVRTLGLQTSTSIVTSPNAQVGVALANLFNEDLLFVDTAGAAGSLLGVTPAGSPPEGDGPRSVTFTPNGLRAITCNQASGNVTLVNALTQTVDGYVTTGDRPWRAAVTPDGTTAVVTNFEASTVSIIDLATDTEVANLSVPTRPTEVVITPDSSKAYVTTIAGADRLAVIDLNGAASSVVASLTTGQLGTTNRNVSAASGLAISPDGSTVAVCVSFDDELMLVDTATDTEVARLIVGDFPLRVAFSGDSSTAWVSNALGASVSVVDVNGAMSNVVTTIPSIDSPFELVESADGLFSYLISFGFASPNLTVLDNLTNTVAATVPLPARAFEQHYSPVDETLYLALTDGSVARVDAAGAMSTLVDTTALSDNGSGFAFSEFLRRAVITQNEETDGLEVVAFGGLFVEYGTGSPGTGGIVPDLVGLGIPSCNQTVTIRTEDGLPLAPGTYLIGLSQTNVPLLGIDVLVNPFNDQPHTLDAMGTFSQTITFPNLPILIGLSIFRQGVYVDPGAPNGIFSATEGQIMRIR